MLFLLGTYRQLFLSLVVGSLHGPEAALPLSVVVPLYAWHKFGLVVASGFITRLESPDGGHLTGDYILRFYNSLFKGRGRLVSKEGGSMCPLKYKGQTPGTSSGAQAGRGSPVRRSSQPLTAALRFGC